MLLESRLITSLCGSEVAEIMNLQRGLCKVCDILNGLALSLCKGGRSCYDPAAEYW